MDLILKLNNRIIENLFFLLCKKIENYTVNGNKKKPLKLKI